MFQSQTLHTLRPPASQTRLESIVAEGALYNRAPLGLRRFRVCRCLHRLALRSVRGGLREVDFVPDMVAVEAGIAHGATVSCDFTCRQPPRSPSCEGHGDWSKLAICRDDVGTGTDVVFRDAPHDPGVSGATVRVIGASRASGSVTLMVKMSLSVPVLGAMNALRESPQRRFPCVHSLDLSSPTVSQFTAKHGASIDGT